MNLADPSRPATVANHPAASGWGVRRAPRHVLAGVALMVTFALLFGLWALRVDPATAVLAVARPVPAGATITDADLQVVRVVPGAGMEVVTEAERATVVGRTATVPLVAGALLAPAHVGAAAWPPAGESVVGVPVAAGRMPAGLSTGSRVSVLVPAGGAPGQPGRAGSAVLSGVVVAVEPPSAAGVSTVSLLMAAGDARRVATAGDVVLVLESPGSGR
jgi:hypothetical protein